MVAAALGRRFPQQRQNAVNPTTMRQPQTIAEPTGTAKCSRMYGGDSGRQQLPLKAPDLLFLLSSGRSRAPHHIRTRYCSFAFPTHNGCWETRCCSYSAACPSFTTSSSSEKSGGFNDCLNNSHSSHNIQSYSCICCSFILAATAVKSQSATQATSAPHMTPAGLVKHVAIDSSKASIWLPPTRASVVFPGKTCAKRGGTAGVSSFTAHKCSVAPAAFFPAAFLTASFRSKGWQPDARQCSQMHAQHQLAQLPLLQQHMCAAVNGARRQQRALSRDSTRTGVYVHRRSWLGQATECSDDASGGGALPDRSLTVVAVAAYIEQKRICATTAPAKAAVVWCCRRVGLHSADVKSSSCSMVHRHKPMQVSPRSENSSLTLLHAIDTIRSDRKQRHVGFLKSPHRQLVAQQHSSQCVAAGDISLQNGRKYTQSQSEDVLWFTCMHRERKYYSLTTAQNFVTKRLLLRPTQLQSVTVERRQRLYAEGRSSQQQPTNLIEQQGLHQQLQQRLKNSMEGYCGRSSKMRKTAGQNHFSWSVLHVKNASTTLLAAAPPRGKKRLPSFLSEKQTEQQQLLEEISSRFDQDLSLSEDVKTLAGQERLLQLHQWQSPRSSSHKKRLSKDPSKTSSSRKKTVVSDVFLSPEPAITGDAAADLLLDEHDVAEIESEEAAADADEEEEEEAIATAIVEDNSTALAAWTAAQERDELHRQPEAAVAAIEEAEAPESMQEVSQLDGALKAMISSRNRRAHLLQETAEEHLTGAAAVQEEDAPQELRKEQLLLVQQQLPSHPTAVAQKSRTMSALAVSSTGSAAERLIAGEAEAAELTEKITHGVQLPLKSLTSKAESTSSLPFLMDFISPEEMHAARSMPSKDERRRGKKDYFGADNVNTYHRFNPDWNPFTESNYKAAHDFEASAVGHFGQSPQRPLRESDLAQPSVPFAWRVFAAVCLNKLPFLLEAQEQEIHRRLSLLQQKQQKKAVDEGMKDATFSSEESDQDGHESEWPPLAPCEEWETRVHQRTQYPFLVWARLSTRLPNATAKMLEIHRLQMLPLPKPQQRPWQRRVGGTTVGDLLIFAAPTLHHAAQFMLSNPRLTAEMYREVHMYEWADVTAEHLLLGKGERRTVDRDLSYLSLGFFLPPPRKQASMSKGTPIPATTTNTTKTMTISNRTTTSTTVAKAASPRTSAAFIAAQNKGVCLPSAAVVDTMATSASVSTALDLCEDFARESSAASVPLQRTTAAAKKATADDESCEEFTFFENPVTTVTTSAYQRSKALPLLQEKQLRFLCRSNCIQKRAFLLSPRRDTLAELLLCPEQLLPMTSAQQFRVYRHWKRRQIKARAAIAAASQVLQQLQCQPPFSKLEKNIQQQQRAEETAVLVPLVEQIVKEALSQFSWGTLGLESLFSLPAEKQTNDNNVHIYWDSLDSERENAELARNAARALLLRLAATGRVGDGGSLKVVERLALGKKEAPSSLLATNSSNKNNEEEARRLKTSPASFFEQLPCPEKKGESFRSAAAAGAAEEKMLGSSSRRRREKEGEGGASLSASSYYQLLWKKFFPTQTTTPNEVADFFKALQAAADNSVRRSVMMSRESAIAGEFHLPVNKRKSTLLLNAGLEQEKKSSFAAGAAAGKSVNHNHTVIGGEEKNKAVLQSPTFEDNSKVAAPPTIRKNSQSFGGGDAKKSCFSTSTADSRYSCKPPSEPAAFEPDCACWSSSPMEKEAKTEPLSPFVDWKPEKLEREKALVEALLFFAEDEEEAREFARRLPYTRGRVYCSLFLCQATQVDFYGKARDMVMPNPNTGEDGELEVDEEGLCVDKEDHVDWLLLQRHRLLHRAAAAATAAEREKRAVAGDVDVEARTAEQSKTVTFTRRERDETETAAAATRGLAERAREEVGDLDADVPVDASVLLDQAFYQDYLRNWAFLHLPEGEYLSEPLQVTGQDESGDIPDPAVVTALAGNRVEDYAREYVPGVWLYKPETKVLYNDTKTGAILFGSGYDGTYSWQKAVDNATLTDAFIRMQMAAEHVRKGHFTWTENLWPRVARNPMLESQMPQEEEAACKWGLQEFDLSPGELAPGDHVPSGMDFLSSKVLEGKPAEYQRLMEHPDIVHDIHLDWKKRMQKGEAWLSDDPFRLSAEEVDVRDRVAAVGDVDDVEDLPDVTLWKEQGDM